jgi:hypothetical protein
MDDVLGYDVLTNSLLQYLSHLVPTVFADPLVLHLCHAHQCHV